jgi:glycosyltransferase involved in cell wall biosynthesis
MYKDKTLCVVIPAFNESNQISGVIETMPDYVDHIVIVDDASTDEMAAVVALHQGRDSRIMLLRHDVNQGCGGALATGYVWARDNRMDIVVRMDGDGQMNPDDLPALLDPVANEMADYAKGNRLVTGEAYQKIPKIRYFGNAFLSLLTKIASGYWHVADFQSGYTAMNKTVLHNIDWNRMYRRFGQPNDLMVRLNVYNFRVADVPVEPVYHVGEKSGIRIRKVIFSISWLLIKMFLWRMKEKYIIRDFHPLIFFYVFGAFFGVITMLLSARLVYSKLMIGFFPHTSSLAAMFSFMSASLFTLFAMWFDMEANKELKSGPFYEKRKV